MLILPAETNCGRWHHCCNRLVGKAMLLDYSRAGHTRFSQLPAVGFRAAFMRDDSEEVLDHIVVAQAQHQISVISAC